MKTSIFKRLPLSALLLVTMLPASAQWKVGIQTGYTHNMLDIDTGYAYDLRHDARSGFTVGIPASYGFYDWLALRAELTWMQKGYKTHRTGQYDGLYTNVRNNYIQLPLLAEFSFGGARVRGLFHLGGYLGWWASGHVDGVTFRYFQENYDVNERDNFAFNERTMFDSRRDNRFEAGLAAGAGVICRLTERVELQAMARYYYSLTDMQKQYMKFQTPRYNTTFVAQLGCMVTLGKIK